jgi:hypothetical protein
LLDELNTDARLLVSHLLVMFAGVIDCLDAAGAREHQINVAAMTNATRPVLEAGGLIAWLLDPDVIADARARRYLRWRFDDLKEMRLLFRDLDNPSERAVRELDDDEADLLARTEAARWQAAPTVIAQNGGVQAAALLDENGRREGMPKIGELVQLLSFGSAIYPVVSITTHGSRLGLHRGFHLLERDEKSARIGFTGFGRDPNLLIAIALLTELHSCQKLAEWNGFTVERLTMKVVELQPNLDDIRSTEMMQ